MSNIKPDVRAIFCEALEKQSPGEVARYLDGACGHDAELRAQVEALLYAHGEVGDFLGGGVSELHATTDEPVTEQAGSVIGPYKLLQQIGEGGMGVVYMAEQSKPVERRVALKIIKLGMDTRQVIARFEAERQALAMMDHPNITKVLDAGVTESGRPYFVMELVKGMPITQYCDDQQLTARKRLELFLPVCRAVQHAHQKGIIHRDLKPSNVMVSLYDDRPVPKVIDFGVAKATSQKLTEKTMFTQYGQIVGTLEYMSPEQAKLNQLDIDTRSDIYSLGVLLYELLTGTTPFDKQRLRSSAFEEIMRIIREEEPPRPSTRLRSSMTLPAIAANRGTEPRKLSALIHGELDWIVMKALEKDRTRRYESASGLAADVQRYMDGELVEAGPPSKIYRLRKFVSRNFRQVVTAAMLLLILVLGFIGTGVGLLRARREAERARIAEADAEAERDNARTLATQNLDLASREQAALRGTEAQLRIAQAQGLAARSQAEREAFPVRSTLLAREAVALTWRHDKTVVPIAHENLLNAVANLGGRSLTGHQAPIECLAVSPDQRWLVTGSGDSTARLWDLKTNAPAMSSVPLSGHQCRLTAVAITSDGRWLLTCAGISSPKPVGEAYLWDLHSEQPAASSILLRHKQGVSAADLSADGRWLVTGSYDGTARRWDLHADDPTVPVVLPAPPTDAPPLLTQTSDVAVSRNGQMIASANADSVRLWRFTSDNRPGEPLVFKSTMGDCYKVAFSPDERWLVSAGNLYTARIWDLESIDPSESMAVLNHRSSIVNTLSFTPDSGRLVTGGNDSVARIWNLKAEDPTLSPILLLGHRDHVSTTAISPNGHWIVTCSRDGTARVWDLRAKDPGATSFILRGHDGAVNAVAFSEDGSMLVTGSYDGTARLWFFGEEGPSESPLKFHRPGADIWELVISPNGRWLAAGKDSISLFDLNRDDPMTKPVAELPGHRVQGFPLGDSNSSIAISSNSRWLASADDKSARLWNLDAETVDESPTVFQHEMQVHSVGFSADSRWLISGCGRPRPFGEKSGPGEVHLWELETESPEASSILLRGNEDAVSIMTASPNGRWLATGGHDGTQIILWNLRAKDPSQSRHVLRVPAQAGLKTISISPDSRWLAAGGIDNVIRLWSLTDAGPAGAPQVLTTDFGHVWILTWSPDGRRLIAGGFQIGIWELSSTNADVLPVKLPSHRTNVRSASISPDGRWLVTTAWRDPARMWDLSADDPASSPIVLRSQGWAHLVASSPHSRWLATAKQDLIQLWPSSVDSLLRYARQIAGRDLTDAERKQYFVPGENE